MIRRLKLRGALRIYLLWPIILTILLLCMNLSVYAIDKDAAVISSMFTLLYLIFSLAIYFSKRNSIAAELVRYAMDYGQVQKKLLKELHLPYAILDLEGKLLWGNDEFMDVVQGKVTGMHSISGLIPEITTEVLPKQEKDEELHITLQNRAYKVLLRKIVTPDFEEESEHNLQDTERIWTDRNALIAMFLYDETDNIFLRKENKEQKQITGLLYIDNYEESLENIDEVRRSLLTALIDQKINKYMQSIDAIIKKLEKDKYIFVFQQKYLTMLQTSKFSILEEVRGINMGNEMSVTISMGLGVNADTYAASYEYARAAIDLALGRGGDQVVIRDREKISYYGGKSVSVEKSTRVKARVKAHALREFIEAKDKVVIMGHKIGDVDSLGSAIGVYRIAKNFNKKAHIVVNEVTSSVRPLMNKFIGNPDYEDDMFIKNEKAKDIVDSNTLLVVVDVNRATYVECQELLSYTKTVVIFDHHRQTKDAIDFGVLSYVEPYASSTSEMIAEIMQYIGGNLKLKSIEADALYAGIMIDTNNFLTKAGVRTFEAAAFLRRNGADVTRIRKCFRSEISDYKIKADAIGSTEIYLNHYAIAVCAGASVDSPMVLGAQVANELLNITDIKATFVFTEYNDKIYISARSIDEVNVQVIMERLGGGGHLSSAGTQFVNTTIEQAIIKIKSTLDEMNREGEL